MIDLNKLTMKELQDLLEKVEARKEDLAKNDRPEAIARLAQLKKEIEVLFAEVETLCSQYSLDFYYCAPNDVSVSYYGESGDGWYSSY